MAEIVVRRQRAFWQDVLRNYTVTVDGQDAGRISNGAELRIPVSPGTHTVQMKIDWCRSKPLAVNVETNRETVLECGPNADPLFTSLIYLTFLSSDYLWLRRV